DFIPTPQMDDATQLQCLRRTMDMNHTFEHDGFVPVMHVCRQLNTYIEEFHSSEQLRRRDRVALGGIVPNLLRMPRAMSYADVLNSMRLARDAFTGKHLHVFGLG